MAGSLRRLVVALVTTASFAFVEASAHQNGDAKAPTNANLAVVQSTNKEGPTHDAKKVQPTIDNSATSN